MNQDAPRPAVEPASDTTTVTDAGSASSPATARRRPPLFNDVLRALICALLVGACVGSPASALLFAPFVPLLVALRVARHRAGARRFVHIATGASLVAAAVSVTGIVDATTTEGLALLSAALLAALLLVPLLGLLHVRAVRHDPVRANADDDSSVWPEPRLDSGFALTIIGWTVAVAMLAVSVLPVIGSIVPIERDIIERAYSIYVEACEPGGSLAARDTFCEAILDQRDQTLELVDRAGAELFAALLAIFVLGGAATTHLLALARLRHASDRIRPRFQLRELEAHWGSAYLVIVGIAGVLLVTGSSDVAVAARATTIAIGTLGALLVGCSGLGLTAWLLTRPRIPGWYRVMVVIASFLMLPIALGILFCFGMLDQWIHPRRRAARSASLDDRGSGR